MRPQAGGGSDENTASGDNAPASGIFEADTEIVDHDGEDVLEHGLEVASSGDEEEPDPRRDLRVEAVSTRRLLTHQPKNRYCKACLRCKMQRTPCKRGASSNYGPKPDKFGDICACDHVVAYDELSKGVNGEEEALVLTLQPVGCSVTPSNPNRRRTWLRQSLVSALSGKSN